MPQAQNSRTDLVEHEGDTLTAKQARFARAFVDGPAAGNKRKAAIAAGYSEKAAGQVACMTYKLPHVQAAIDEILRAEIGAALTVQAVIVMRQVLKDENAPLKLRADVACKIVEYSGIVARVGVEKARQTGLDGGASLGPKRLGEMTREELETVCRQGAGILAAAAALPPAGVTIDQGKREGFTITDQDEAQEPSEDSALA